MNRYSAIVLLSILICCITIVGFAQPVTGDSSVMALPEVRVSAFAQTRKLNENPSPVSVISKSELERFSNISLLPAMNTAPGVRMEERSPGSYRLSIRGSSLRSPFGVRNVKIYYNDIPITDPGGFSYFNQLSFGNVATIQILKGPSGSLYGQGNGGTLQISSMKETVKQGVSIGAVAGSYNLYKTFAEARIGDSSQSHIIRFEQVNSDGYREQAALGKKSLAYDAMIHRGALSTIDVHLLYNKIQYQTPGALTQKEYERDPRSARPDAGSVPGSIRQQAQIVQENLLIGFSASNTILHHWQSKATLYCLYSQMDNPAIRNYSTTVDPHFGGRATLSRHKEFGAHAFDLVFGVELQQSRSRIMVYGNKAGIKDTLQTSDEIRSANTLGFAQLSWQYKRWTIEGGACIGGYKVYVNRTVPIQVPMKTAQAQVSPRLAVLYRMGSASAMYINIARGYSSPTVAELAPSGSSINAALLAEHGLNFELGSRGTFGIPGLRYDISAFYYELTNAIVLRKDSAGGDSYVNAGGTKQFGLEGKVDYNIIDQPASVFKQVKIFCSYTLYDFKYGNFIQGEDDFSGKQLPGTAVHTVAAGMDIQLPFHFAVNASYYFSSRIALNDANTAYADPYHLLGIKCSYRPKSGKLTPELFAGADNILNQKYSLGNDINAAGGRYYNAAMPLNFYAGLTLHWLP